MFDVLRIKSTIPKPQDIILMFSFTMQFQLYSKILNNSSIKTDSYQIYLFISLIYFQVIVVD